VTTALAKRPGRPPRGAAPRTLTPFGSAVVAALGARRDALAEGPRTLAELARVLNVDKMTLQRALDGQRRMRPALEAGIRAAMPELPGGASQA